MYRRSPDVMEVENVGVCRNKYLMILLIREEPREKFNSL